MAFQQGLSGLNSSARALDVISSNVANASTAGFKASSAVFADTFAAAMGGGTSATQVGMGSVNQAIRQSFSQGAITATNNPLDMAIGGNGFFVVQRNNESTAYTRNGQFDLDKDGYIVTPLGERLMGYQTVANDGSVSFIGNTTPRAILVPPTGISAAATGTSGAPVGIRANLDSGMAVPATTPFDQSDPGSYNFATSVAVYDSLGNQHSLALYFVKQDPVATPNTWQVFQSFDNGPTGASAATLVFDQGTGNWVSGGPIAVSVPAATVGTGGADMNFDVSLSAFTQRRSVSAVYETTQDGSPPGEVASVSVSTDGLVQARYTNGQTRDLGKVILATFRNPNGLSSVGDNLWAETIDSGAAALAGPGDGLNGTINSGRIEESNVDMSQELVHMIVQQRNYQANAQSIRTQDQLLQTLINLR